MRLDTDALVFCTGEFRLPIELQKGPVRTALRDRGCPLAARAPVKRPCLACIQVRGTWKSPPDAGYSAMDASGWKFRDWCFAMRVRSIYDQHWLAAKSITCSLHRPFLRSTGPRFQPRPLVMSLASVRFHVFHRDHIPHGSNCGSYVPHDVTRTCIDATSTAVDEGTDMVPLRRYMFRVIYIGTSIFAGKPESSIR